MTETMISELRHGDPATHRRHAALALGTSKETGLVPVLVEALRTETDGRVREDITWAIVQHADEAEGHIQQMLVSENPSDRFSGAHVISKIANPAHFDAVAPLVLDEHVDVAIKAYRAAAHTGGERAPAVLVQRLGDGDELQRDALSDAFRKLGEIAVPALVGSLADDDADVRDHAVEALGYLGEHAAAAADALEARVADEHEPIRLTAVSALGQLGEAAAPALQRASGSDDPVLSGLAKRFLEKLAA
ncbi:MAG: HEAT repeat domain-containing protein [Propionibacterium sp.]|nr:HEAT repeat domain-containing protein [Propionibacterium sp.]